MKTIFQCSYTDRCPNPVSSTIIPTTTEEPFNDQNEVSNRERADRSFNPEPMTTTWAPRTVIYTLPPESGSQTSGTNSLINTKLVKTLFFAIPIFIFSILNF